MTDRDPDPRPRRERATTGRGRLERLAGLIADGELDFPEGLDPPEYDRLTEAVRGRLRRRLLGYLARQIALDIHCGRGRTP